MNESDRVGGKGHEGGGVDGVAVAVYSILFSVGVALLISTALEYAGLWRFVAQFIWEIQ